MTATVTEYVLWFRSSARAAWHPVAVAASYAAALAHIRGHNGDWLVRPKGAEAPK